MTDISVDAILDRLRAGEAAEDIANEMISALNGAINKKSAEDEAEELERKRKAEEKAQLDRRLNSLADAIAEAVGEYMKLSMPEYADDMKAPTMEDVRKTLDRSVKIMLSLGSTVERLMEANPALVNAVAPKVITPNAVDTTDPITKFLRDNKLM